MSRFLQSILLPFLMWAVPAVCSTAFAASAADPIRVTADLDHSRIYLDQEGVLEVAVDFVGDGRGLVLDAPVLPALQGVRIGNRTALTETRWDPAGVRTSVRHVFSLIPELPGTVALDSLRVAWIDPSTGEGGSRVVSAGELRVAKRPPVIGMLVLHPVRSLTGIGLAFVGTGVLVWLRRRRRGGREPERALHPVEILERDWRRLRILARRGALGPFSDECSRAVRRFIKENYGIPAERLPAAAVVENLETANVPSGQVLAVQRVLNFVDDMRFGLWIPTHPELDVVLGDVEKLWAEGRRAPLVSDPGPSTAGTMRSE